MTLAQSLLKRSAYHILYPFLVGYRLLRSAKDSARALVIHRDEILLVRHIGVGHWSLPGGTLHRFEMPIQALKRELKEELGVTLTSNVYRYKLGTYTGERGDRVHIFVVQAPSFAYKPDLAELDDADWFNLSDLPGTLSPATLRRLEEFRSGVHGTFGHW